jgi:hypothetical protein
VTDHSLEDRVTALKRTVDEVRKQLDRAMNRDIPLLKGAVRAAIDADIDDIGELPDAGRTFNQQVATAEERLDAVERQLAALGDIGTAKTTKEQKLAAILTFAANKRGQQSSTVTVTADEVQGCAGVSRRYAYDLIDEAAEVCVGVRIREATDIQTSTGVEHKKKALLVDGEVAHTNGDGVNQFTTEKAVAQESDLGETSSAGDR